MDRRIEKTKDGSNTIYVPGLGEHYHSIHGAFTESDHIFIKHGLNCIDKKVIRIFEMGLGTGINVLLTLAETSNKEKNVFYTGLEKYPISETEVKDWLDGNLDLVSAQKHMVEKMHQISWGEYSAIQKGFLLRKIEEDIRTWGPDEKYDLVYYDAFAPSVQPHLWGTEIFKKLYDAMEQNGVLVTYTAKGDVRRSLLSVGFEVEKVPGPPGKREFLRAKKVN